MQQLRSSPFTASTPIAILSADASPDQPKRLIAAGATTYLTKPLNVPNILEMIDGIVPNQLSAAGLRQDAKARVDVEGLEPDDGTATFMHEMVNLLGVIMTYCDLLEADGPNSSKFAWLEQQRVAAERAIQMTKQLWVASARV